MQSEQFKYPPYDIPLVEAYGGQFESVFIVLHPFVRVPEALAWCDTQKYPNDTQIVAQGAKHPWVDVVEQTGLGTCARVGQALLTSIGSLDDHLADPIGRASLEKFLQAQPIWMPVEGRFEPLLQRDFLHAFEEAEQRNLSSFLSFRRPIRWCVWPLMA